MCGVVNTSSSTKSTLAVDMLLRALPCVAPVMVSSIRRTALTPSPQPRATATACSLVTQRCVLQRNTGLPTLQRAWRCRRRARAVYRCCSPTQALGKSDSLSSVRVSLSLLLGATGAACFLHLHLPLPYMLGALTACAVGGLAGAPLALPSRLRLAWQTVIGVALGCNFNATLFSGALSLSVAGLLASTVAATTAAAWLLQKVARYEHTTAFFAAVPGGLNDMTAIGSDAGGDEATIALSHSVRLVVVVSVLPFLLRSAFATSTPAVAIAPIALLQSLSPADALLLSACAIAGPRVAQALRLPARGLIGPMLLSAVVHLAGLTAARPPPQLIAVAQLVVGTAVGCRFVGVQLSSMRRVAFFATGTTALQMAVSAAFALSVSRATGTPFPQLLLAYSPGGITEMCLSAAELGCDPAFVATHHLVRIVAIVICTPIAFAAAARYREKQM